MFVSLRHFYFFPPLSLLLVTPISTTIRRVAAVVDRSVVCNEVRMVVCYINHAMHTRSRKLPTLVPTSFFLLPGRLWLACLL
ncbi:hypothetical protein F4809DRAFT_635445 [Biscogniauxia mediterranea]|nr:hypothetical protein F4809DRAFT_635445 [Biscogniauxia mediterranea]